jgi:D-glycero-D-manno-heptose 1,7-bisphosphate phosphatase
MKLVILDRDGVINIDSANFIKNPNEWVPITGSLEAIAMLNQSGFRVALATNQSGIARGLFDMVMLNAIHDKMHRALALVGGRVDALFYCPHAADDNCNCRKPKPGLLLRCALDYQFNLTETVMVGDSYRDLQAASAAGAKPILVKTGKGGQTLSEHPNLNLPVFENLYDAARHLVSGQ